MKLIQNLRKLRLKSKDFTIFSNNCLAGFIYQRYNLKYNTPTIGMNIEPEDFIKFCKNYEYYVSLDLEDTQEYNQDWFYSIGGGKIDFPVGKLGDIKLYFQHSKNFTDAKKDWDKRKNRINKDKLFFILFDMTPSETTCKSFEDINSENKLYLYHKGTKINSQYAFKIEHIENTNRAWWSRMNKSNPFSKKYFEQFDFTRWFNKI